MEKQKYSQPEIEVLRLDNEISLQLESTPPTYEKTQISTTPDYFNYDPFKKIV